MRKLILLCLCAIVSFAAHISYTESGHQYEYAIIKNIRIGDNFEEACQKIKYLVKENDPDSKVHVSKDSCVFGLFGMFGVEADAEGVSQIRIPVGYLGYVDTSTPQAVKKVAQDYLLSPNNMVSSLQPYNTYNKYDKKYYLSYYGYNAQGTVKIEINHLYIELKKVSKGSF